MMPPKKRPILLVEGQDDRHFFGHFCVRRGAPLGWMDSADQPAFAFDTRVGDGYPEILEALIRLLTDRELPQIGVVFDADDEAQGRWERLRQLAGERGYQLPNAPETTGTIAPPSSGGPTLGIWLMPDNRAAGMLEHFAEFLVPNGDTNPSWAKAKSVVADLSEQERAFTANQHQKAVVHTWLAWQDEPGTPLGQAVTKRYLDPTVPQADQLADWLIRLFKLDLPARAQPVG